MSKKLLAILVLLVVGSVSALTARPAFTAEDKVGDAVNDPTVPASAPGGSNLLNLSGDLSNPNDRPLTVLPTPTPSCSYKPLMNNNPNLQ